MFNQSITCLVCEKPLEKSTAIKAHNGFFCSPDCLAEYEKQLKQIGENLHLDDCC